MSDVELRLVADVDEATNGIRAFSKQYRDMVKEVSKPLKQINAFRDLEQNLESAERSTRSARERVRELGNELASSATPTRALTSAYRDAVAELRRMERAESSAGRQLAVRRRELQAAGIDTRNLVLEQKRLQGELASRMAQGRADATQQAALDRLGVSRVRELRAQLVSLRGDYDRLNASARISATERIALERRYQQQLTQTRAELRTLTTEQSAGGAAGGGGMAAIAGRAAGILGAAYAGKQLLSTYTSITDRVGEMNDRLLNAVGTQEKFAFATDRLRDISNRTYTDMASNADLFIGSFQPLQEAGFDMRQILDLTEALGLGLVASAAKGDRARQVIDNFNKAMQMGVLRGEEFNSVITVAPELANALAAGLGKTRQELQQMAQAGELTSQRVIPALISQMPQLGQKVDEMRVTVGDGALRVSNAFDNMVSNFDEYIGLSESFADSLKDLAEQMNVLADGNIAAGSGGIIGELLSWSPAGKAAEWTGFSETLSKAFAKVVGGAEGVVDAQSKLELQLSLEDNAALDRNVRRLTEEQRHAAEMRGVKFDEVEALKGWARVMGTTYEAFIAREAERNRLREAGEQSHQQRMKSVRSSALAEIQKDIDAQQKLIEAGNKKVKEGKDKQLAIEKEFNQLISDVRSGGASRGAPTFGDVQVAQNDARQALRAKDYEGAINAARRAGEILKQLQSNGANTYGFAGIAKQIADIAKEAAALEQRDVEGEVKAVEGRMQELIKLAEAVKVVSIDVEIDPANVDTVKAQFLQLAKDLAKAMVIVPTVLGPDGKPVTAENSQPPVPAFATGGIIRGPGTGTSDSIVARLSNGEGVLNARAVRHFGPEFVHQLNRLQMPAFADGGVFRAPPISAPSIPQPSQALLDRAAGPDFRDYGTLKLDFGGDNTQTVYVDKGGALDLGRLARKHGRPR